MRFGFGEWRPKQGLSMTNRRQNPSQTRVIAQNRFSISKVGRKQEPSDLRVEVVNNLGQTSFSETLRSFSGSYVKDMDLTRESEGAYHLKITRGGKTGTHKIVYQR